MKRTIIARWAVSGVVLTALTLGACGDDASGPDGDAILGSWQVTSFTTGPIDLVNAGMDLDVILNSDGTYRFVVTNDQAGVCGDTPGQSCQTTGPYVYTSNTITIDSGQADAVTFNYSITGNGNFMTWTGSISSNAVQITLQRT